MRPSFAVAFADGEAERLVDVGNEGGIFFTRHGPVRDWRSRWSSIMRSLIEIKFN